MKLLLSKLVRVNMERVKVVTARGEIKYEDECVLVGHKYFRKDDPELVFDYATGSLGIKSNMHSVAVGYTEDLTGKKIINWGFTSSYDVIPCHSNENGNFSALSIDVAKEMGLHEGILSGRFYCEESLRHDRYSEYRRFNAIRSNKNCKTVAEKIKYGIYSPTFLINENKRYTFGLELETTKGLIPSWLDKDLNVQCVRDGSVDAGEYVTGILVGDAGFMQAQKLCNEASRRCSIDASCGMHVHIGGMNPSKEFIVLAYKLGRDIQGELSEMLPYSRRDNNFCRDLDNLGIDMNFYNSQTRDEYNIKLKEAYSAIMRFLSHTGQMPSKSLNKKKNHPMGSKCGYNKDTPRYCWLNLIPTAFNTRHNGSYSLEFRNHSGTLNFVKVKNWVKICMAFVWIVENHPQKVASEKLTLADILRLAYPKTGEKLIQYVEKRKELFLEKADVDHSNERKEYSKARSNSIKDLKVRELV